jgi:hypothetical protein
MPDRQITNTRFEQPGWRRDRSAVFVVISGLVGSEKPRRRATTATGVGSRVGVGAGSAGLSPAATDLAMITELLLLN